MTPEQPDIVTRLRERAGKYDEYDFHGAIELEAAREIHNLRAALSARPEAIADTARLDALEKDVTEHGPLLLHNLQTTGNFRGLGLASTGRSLRKAIDDMAPHVASIPPEGGKLVLATEKGLTPIGECIAAMEEMIAALQEVDDYPAQEKAEKRARAAIAAAFGVSPLRRKPPECEGGCPPKQVCDYCQFKEGE